jgi:cytoplasmic iron level regulating protein YaaA (DUF328/UPF0246 family)
MKIYSENRRFELNLHPMKILLSPAKLMRSFPQDSNASSRFQKERKELMSVLKSWSVAEFKSQMKLSEEKAMETLALTQKWGSKSNKVNGAPALFAYIGEAFKALNAAQLAPHELVYLQENLLILSGLYGILRPEDNVEPYRLEMAQRGVAPAGQSLYTFWRAPIEKYLFKELQKGEQILNLASSEYSDLLQDQRLRARLITPHFFELKNGQLKSVSVFSKQARGTMARWCAKRNTGEPLEVKDFKDLGYQYSSEKSGANDLVFIR